MRINQQPTLFALFILLISTTPRLFAQDSIAPARPVGLSLASSSIIGNGGSEDIIITARILPNAEQDLAEYSWSLKRFSGTPSFSGGKLVGSSFSPFDPVFQRTPATVENIGGVNYAVIRLTGLRANAWYIVRVAAIDRSGNYSSYTAEDDESAFVLTAKDSTPPAPPSSISATSAFTTVFLSWTNPEVSDYDFTRIYGSRTSDRSTATLIGSAYGPSFNVSDLAGGTFYYYWLQGVDRSGNASFFSPMLSLQTGYNGSKPSISTQPSNQTASLGQAVSLRINASGVPAPLYQWYKDGSPVAGATSSSLSIPSAASANAGVYAVSVSNSAGTITSSNASLSVSFSPIVTSAPTNQVVTAGAAITLSVTASASPAPSYQWLKNGSPIVGATSSSYSLSPARPPDSGNYQVSVSNSIGTALSSTAVVTVNEPPQISQQPTGQIATVGSRISLTVTASGTPSPTFQWRKDGVPIAGASSATFLLTSASISDSGSYTVAVTNVAGSLVSAAATLTVSTTTPPSIVSQPAPASIFSGDPSSFSVTATGTPPFSYQWEKNGTTITGATASTFTISSATTRDSGSYTVRVSNSVGTAVSNAAILTVSSPRLSNLSVRTTLEANQVLIVGMTMTGGAKNVLLRAIGPTLGVFGVPDVMADPKLDLFSGSTKVTSNDNWQGLANLVSTFQTVGAFALSSASSLDAALFTSIDGGRTVQVSGSTAGTVLVEGYDAGSGDSPRFSNLSARNKVGTGANILIAGFNLSGNGTRNLLIRAVGPKLADFGVSGVLQDPKVQIYRGQTVVAENDNWAGSLGSTFSSVGAFGLTSGSKDAALVISLQAGSYTVQVSGADGGTGEAIVEIYELP